MELDNVRELVRPFDPISAEAEERYDDVVRRLNRIRVRSYGLKREFARLERQFVENDLVAASGKTRGQPLTPAGRRRRLVKLVDLGTELRRLAAEEDFALASLERMNSELDRWARETYGA